MALFEIDKAPRVVDVRNESEYIHDVPKQSDLEEVRQRYKFTCEFLEQELLCSRCGQPYRPRENFAGYRCAMHPGSIQYDYKTNEFYYTCCKEEARHARLTVGCVPCMHSFRREDFERLIMPQREYKSLPIDMVDILKPFPIDKNLIVAANHRDGMYMFAMSRAQWLRVKALDHPDRPIPNTKYENDDEDAYCDEGAYCDTAAQLEEEEQKMVDDWTSSIVVGQDNWKIKMFLH